MGQRVDVRLAAGDTRLTMGGEPTFVSIDDMDGAEGNTAALGSHKRQRAGDLFRRLARRYATGPLLHYGQGKWYPGESLPRWALACYWRKDGVPIWRNTMAVGATASRQWLPGQPLFENLTTAGSEVGRFRAVLWHQGESDVIERTDAATYVQRLVEIRQAAAQRWGFEPPWLLAESTLHPTVYNDPLQEGQIREAIERLWRLPGFRRGPDTEILGGENRGGVQSMRHFSPIGQIRAGLLWFAAVWNELNQNP